MFNNKVVPTHNSYPFSTSLSTEDWKDACSTANVHHNLLQAIDAAICFTNTKLPHNKSSFATKITTQKEPKPDTG